MEANIAEEALSDASEFLGATDATPDTESEHAEGGKKKKQGLIFEGPISGLVTIDRFAPYAGFTTGAVRAMCRRRQLPAHKMKDPEKPNSDGTWYINRARWDKLAEILPELEPPEWHSWEDYWTYDRKSAALKMKEKAKKAGAHGRASTTRRSKLEMSKGTA
ncbi:regulatory phage cox family protein [Serratia marcescens]|uniref:regulatory phage cox family protein n=1 Tax=Serratia marcescens TaxID=615 RepID=UPI00217ADD76|nr:regulatory phage cox family protein [Serratia marcescens]CAI1970858.1 Regulatory phage protein cox [Serratia marcescens]